MHTFYRLESEFNLLVTNVVRIGVRCNARFLFFIVVKLEKRYCRRTAEAKQQIGTSKKKNHHRLC